MKLMNVHYESPCQQQSVLANRDQLVISRITSAVPLLHFSGNRAFIVYQELHHYFPSGRHPTTSAGELCLRWPSDNATPQAPYFPLVKLGEHRVHS